MKYFLIASKTNLTNGDSISDFTSIKSDVFFGLKQLTQSIDKSISAIYNGTKVKRKGDVGILFFKEITEDEYNFFINN